jgi:heme exporter protein D
MSAMGGLVFLVWLVLMLGVVAGWILFLVVLWRGMKAHESVAASLKRVAEKQG